MSTTNRNPVRHVFITWPKTPITAPLFAAEIRTLFDVQAIEVATEKHSDGTDHLHAVIQFNNKYSCPHILKKFKDKYPDSNKRIHVRSIRSLSHALTYIRKEDNAPVCFGTFEETSAKTLSRARWVRQTKHDLLWKQDLRKCPGWSISRPYSELLSEYLAEQSALTNHAHKFENLGQVYDFYDLLRQTQMSITEYNSIS